jgi:hypothetical protein
VCGRRAGGGGRQLACGVGVVVEVQPPHFEALVERMFVVARDRRRRMIGRTRCCARTSDRLSVAVAELHGTAGSGWPIGVAGDTESALVMEPMVLGAQTEQVGGIRAAAAGPVDDVMCFDDTIAVTARNTAAAVTVFDEATGAVGHDVLGSPNRHRDAVCGVHDGGDRVTCDPPGRASRDPAPAVVGDCIRGGVDVDVGAVAASTSR